MNPAAYDEFVEAQRSGRKSAAKAAVRAFTASFASFDEQQAWVRVFLQAHDPQTRIRHEIYQTLVLPVLLKGYHASDVWSTRWLAATSRNLDEVREVSAQMGFISRHQLLKRWHLLAPECPQARQALLEDMIDQLMYCEHEWPGIILCGMDGATLEECSQLGNRVVDARKLDSAGIWTVFLKQFEEKLGIWRQRLLAEGGR